MATKKEILRQHQQAETLQALGFTEAEAEQLRRISMTLRAWFERECNGEIQRDEEIGSPTEGKPIYWAARYDGTPVPCGPIPDRETGARKRLTKIIMARNNRETEGAESVQTLDGRIFAHFGKQPGPFETREVHHLRAYIQTDPRGAALYIIRPGDVPEGCDVSAYYSRGICVY